MERYDDQLKSFQEPLETRNTPFYRIPRDVVELLLDLLDTASVFNLMLVSHNSKIIACSEFHWKKRLFSLFSKPSIARHVNETGIYQGYRLIAVKMINRQRNKDELTQIITSVYPHLSPFIQLEDDGVEAINETIMKYMRRIAMFPLAEFERLIHEDFPKTMAIDGMIEISRVRSRILSFYRNNQSRFGVVGVLINLMHSILKYRDLALFRKNERKIIFTRENVIISLYRIIHDASFQCHLDYVIDNETGAVTYGPSNFTLLLQEIVNVQNYPYLEDS